MHRWSGLAAVLALIGVAGVWSTTLAAAPAPTPTRMAPIVSCGEPPPITNDDGTPVTPLVLTCARAIEAALKGVDHPEDIERIAFQYGIWCEPEQRCPPTSVEDGIVLLDFRFEPDLLVAVTVGPTKLLAETKSLPASATFPGDPEPFTPLPLEAAGPAVPIPTAEPVMIEPVGPPSARHERNGIVLELWVPDGPLAIGEWLPATMRVTNASDRTIRFQGDATDPLCSPFGAVWADTAALFDPGERWAGNAGAWKEEVIAQATRRDLFTPNPEQLACGETGVMGELRPGRSITLQQAGVLTAPDGVQALPAGEVIVRAAFSYEFPTQNARQRLVSVSAPLTTDGHPYPWVSPGQIADAALRSPGFQGWLDSRDRIEQVDWRWDADPEKTYVYPNDGGTSAIDTLQTATVGAWDQAIVPGPGTWRITLDGRTGAVLDAGPD